jgi:hypothetical protein
MFGKTRCKLCGDEVRLALKHLRDKHGIFDEIRHMRMDQIMSKYFEEPE